MSFNLFMRNPAVNFPQKFFQSAAAEVMRWTSLVVASREVRVLSPAADPDAWDTYFVADPFVLVVP